MGDHRLYDMVVVGAGPAGLSAARTATRLGFRTLVLERSEAAGELTHPCSAILAPIPGLVSGRRRYGGLFFPRVDLLVPDCLILGYPAQQRYVSPGGHEFRSVVDQDDDQVVAAVDKRGLLNMLSDQATAAGAEIQFGNPGLRLLRDGGRVVGVQTQYGAVRAPMVLSAEGASRHLSKAAGLFPAGGSPAGYAFVATQEMEAPRASRQHVGQTMTFGRRYTSAREGFGTVIVSEPGRALVHFTLFSDGPHHHTLRSSWFYLKEYVEEDPRVRDILAGGQPLSRYTYRMVLRHAPTRVTRPGFMSLGDSATPGGHLGILPAIFMGRQAALIAAEALDAGDVSSRRLAPYEYMYRGPILRSLNAERRLLSGLVRLADDDLDRIYQALAAMQAAAPAVGSWRLSPWDSLSWMAEQMPLLANDWELLQKVVGSSTQPEPAPGQYHVMPLPFGTSAFLR